MSLISIQWNPPNRTLRQFGWIFAAFVLLVGWIVAGRPVFSGWDRAVWPLGIASGVGLIAVAVGTIRPEFLKPVFVGLSLITAPIGMVVGELVMLLLFFVVFTPIALVFRGIGRDALERRFDPKASTYWRPKSQPSDVRRYFRQY